MRIANRMRDLFAVRLLTLFYFASSALIAAATPAP
jgi:hypothetical protein